MKSFLTFKAAKRQFDLLQNSPVWESSHNEIRFRHRGKFYSVVYAKRH